MLRVPWSHGMDYQDWQRSYLGYRERFVDDFELLLPNGRKISVQQAPSPGKAGANYREEGDPMVTGTTVWDAGIMLAIYLAGEAGANLARHWGAGAMGCLELGAGTGLVSLAAAASLSANGAWVVATDIPSMIPFIEANIKRNGKALRRIGNNNIIAAYPMRWCNKGDMGSLRARFGSDIRLIIGSDILYSEQTPQGELILGTLRELCGPDTVVLIAAHKHHNPELVDAFIRDAKQVFSLVEDVTSHVDPQWVCQDGIMIRLAHIRPHP